MGRFGRAEILFSMALLLGGTTLVSGAMDAGVVKSTDFDNTAPQTQAPNLAACSNRASDPFALHDYGDLGAINCQGTPVAPTFPVNVRDDLTFIGGLQAGIVFVKDGTTVLYTASSPAPCGPIDECKCDSAELLTARLFNSYKRRGIGGLGTACPSVIPAPATYDVKQKIGGGGFGGTCTFADVPGPAGACRDLAPGESGVLLIQRTDLGSPNCGFTLSFGPAINNGKSLRIEPDFPHCALGATFAISNAGNTHGDDLLPDLLLQLKRNGVNGNVLFEIRKTVNASPIPFTITTTAGETDTQVHTDIATHLNAILTDPSFTNVLSGAEVVPNAAAKSVVEPLAPGTYAAGPGVQFRGFGFKAYSIHYKAEPGMQVVSENIDPTPGNPTLNEWGMIILTGLLLASGYWLFRRQRRLAAI